jgi:predicted MPP superfamily phosphohydrolase
LWERNRFTLREVIVPVLPPGSEPIRILHLSDLHLLPHQKRKIAWIRRLGQLQPDFVVNTGDNVSSPKALPALARALEPLQGIPGVFVNGSNDFNGPGPVNPFQYFKDERPDSAITPLPVEAMWSLFREFGWRRAEEKRLRYTLRGSTIEVRGCGDAHINADYYPLVAGAVDEDVDLLLGVTHAPYRRVLDQMVADGAGLIIAGHTHGGQVCLPGGHALTTNCDLPSPQAKGLSMWTWGDNASFLHVSAGLGTSPYAPVRMCCPPEATLLTLTSRV